MRIEDGGWRLLGVLDSPSLILQEVNRLEVLSMVSMENLVFSIDLDAWNDEEDTSFDLMIEYGDEDTYREVVTGFTKMALVL